MTIHSFANYQCRKCGIPFIPMPITPNCPNCGTVADKIFSNFLNETLTSARFNYTDHKLFSPFIWAMLSVGDHYYYLAFRFLDFAQATLKREVRNLVERKIPYDEAVKTVTKFLEEVDVSKQPYMAPAYKAYLAALISSGDNTRNKKPKPL